MYRIYAAETAAHSQTQLSLCDDQLRMWGNQFISPAPNVSFDITDP
jgi:hypothetical protein